MSAIHQETTPPRLQPPGAGLPWLELRLANLLVAFGKLTSTREGRAARFASEQTALRALADARDPATARRRVLVPRLPGMEDSSRFWSVYMTLDHLRIVNDSIGALIEGLAHGRLPDRPANTANVKPSPNADADVVEAFTQSCARFAQRVAAMDDLRTAARAAHPWFGPQDAAGWHFIAAMHMGLHRRQIGSILDTLKASAR